MSTRRGGSRLGGHVDDLEDHQHRGAGYQRDVATLAEMIEVRAATEIDPFHDAGTPVEAYDLRHDGTRVGQVLRDATQLNGMRAPTHQWVLVQSDADLLLAVNSADEALERARAMIAARLANGELPIAPKRPHPAAKRLPLARTALAIVAAIATAKRVRARD